MQFPKLTPFGYEISYIDDTIATASNKEFSLRNKNLIKFILRLTGIPHFGTRIRAFYLNKLMSNHNNGKVMLDAGCGIGLNSFLAARKGFSVIGIDNDKKKIEIAKKMLTQSKSTNVNFILGDITRMDFKDKNFDCVICVEVLEHIDEDRKALHEITRVLKNNGMLLLSVPGIGFISQANQHDKHHVREGYSLDDLHQKLNASGLRIVKIMKLQHTPLGLLVGVLNSEVQKKSLLMAALTFPIFFLLAIIDGLLYEAITPHNWIVAAEKI